MVSIRDIDCCYGSIKDFDINNGIYSYSDRVFCKDLNGIEK